MRNYQLASRSGLDAGMSGPRPGTPQRRGWLPRCRLNLSNLSMTVCCMVLLSSLLGGCALPSFLSFKGDKVKWPQVTLSASDDANNNSPIAVDVVFVTDETLVARLAELPALKWFSARADLANTYPDALRYRSWELVPGQQLVIPGKTFEGPRVAGAFIFANYPDPGAHRVRIEQFGARLAVQLDNNTFSVSAVK
jgi:type VI secretion system protein